VLDAERMHDEFADPAHVLHGRHEWDDAVAGRKYRVEQINKDIRLVKIEFISQETGEVSSVRAYSSVNRSTAGGGTGYVATETLVQDPLAARIMLRRAERELEECKKRYEHLEGFIELVQRMFGEDAA
jgi:hypothetical protein